MVNIRYTGNKTEGDITTGLGPIPQGDDYEGPPVFAQLNGDPVTAPLEWVAKASERFELEEVSDSEMPKTDERVLANPGNYTVDEVTEVFERSSDEDVKAAQRVEKKDGKDRKAIAEWTRPEPEVDGSTADVDGNPDGIAGQPGEPGVVVNISEQHGGGTEGGVS